MGRLQTSIGLITGTDIVGTVEQLVSLSGAPKRRLEARNEVLSRQQEAISSLTASVISVQLSGDRLGDASLFRSRSATSSNTDALSVTNASEAQAGRYEVVTEQLAATHSLASRQRFDSSTDSLGIEGRIDVRTTGDLRQSTSLQQLNGGLGVQGGSILITDRSGATAEVNLANARTIDDVLEAINQNTGIQVRATANRQSIVLTDLTGQTVSNLRVREVGQGETAADLGFFGVDVAAASATGQELVESDTFLSGVSLSELRGGQGLGPLTTLNISLRDGSAAAVDLSAAETIQDVIAAINDTGLNLTARLNDSGTGLRLRDLSGGTTESFSVSSADHTAARLGIAQTSSQTTIHGQHLNRQAVDRDTLLTQLNQGQGVTPGSFELRDSTGKRSAINMVTAGISTVGELIDRINNLGLGLQAQLSAGGDGITIVDSAGGEEIPRIFDLGSSVAASQLGIAASASVQTIDGSEVLAVVGGDSFGVTITATDSLEDIARKINDSDRFVKATVQQDESGQHYLRVSSLQGGQRGRFSLHADGLPWQMETTAIGQDAAISIMDDSRIARRLTSADGVFVDNASGLNLTVKSLSAGPVIVDVTANRKAALDAVKTFVTQFNQLNDRVRSLTSFDAADNTVGLLFGSTETLRIETGYARLLSGVIRGNGPIQSFGELGLRLNENGKLDLDESRLERALENNAEAVEAFFTTETTGASARLKNLADRLAGVDNGMLLNRGNALTRRVEQNNERIAQMDRRLENERERLLRQFFEMEAAISRIQSNQQYITGIQPISFPDR